MKPINILLFLLTLAVTNIQAQTVYHFKYNTEINNKVVPINALYFQNEEGAGFLRTRFTEPISKEEIVLEMNLIEEEILDANMDADTTKMYVHTSNPKVILGNFNVQKDTPVFLFTLNNTSGFFEPKAIMKNSNQQFLENKDAKFIAQIKEGSEVNSDFFSNYFQEGEEFYEQYFKINTKDIMPAEKNVKMFLILVANTWDEKIGVACAQDLEKMKNTFVDLTNYMGCKIIIDSVVGVNYSKKSVLQKVDLLKPGSNDIVVFYYTGHGFRKLADKRLYPYMDLRANLQQDYLQESLNMEDIYNAIKMKNARMNLVFSDCCNSYVGAEKSFGTKPLRKKAMPQLMRSSNVRKLFLTDKISILASAADSTEKAACNKTFGSYFTYFFKSNLETNCSIFNNDANWYTIFNVSTTQTTYKATRTYCEKPKIPSNICVQNPKFKIEKR